MMQKARILTLTPPSKEQLPAVLADHEQVIVTAGAGTGKTRTLVARYLELLSERVPIRSIAAVTFTRKAAREMRNRVRQEIERYIATLNSQDDLSERSAWAERYQKIDGARIGTIHSLCGEILRSSPAEAGLDPRFDVLPDAQMVLMRSDAVEQAMGVMADDEEGSALFELLDERDLRKVLTALVGSSLDMLAMMEQMPSSSDQIKANWRAALERETLRCAAQIFHDPEWQQACRIVDESHCSDQSDKLYPAWTTAMACAELQNAEHPIDIKVLQEMVAVPTRGGRQANWGSKEALACCRDAFTTMKDLIKASGLLNLKLTEVDDRLADHLPALCKATLLAQRMYQTAKHRQQALDYDDLEQKALELLTTNGQVATRWQNEIQALLVDEFQDTNAQQLSLVQALCGPNTQLFCVGDAKQSIYAFRGADVTVFRKLRQEASTRTLSGESLVVDLQESYRGHAPLVEALNDLLEPILGSEPDPLRPWREPFGALTAFRHQPGTGFDGPHVEAQIALGTKENGALRRAAALLVTRLEELVCEGTHWIGRDENKRPLNYGDIAVLCRTSNAFEAYEDAFEQAGLPFYTAAGKGFYGRSEIRDVLNAMAAVADPTDDLALCGLLRSPAIGATDAALYWLTNTRYHHEWQEQSLFALLNDPDTHTVMLKAMSDDDSHTVERGISLVSALHHEAGRVSVDRLIKKYLSETGYRVALEMAGQSRAAHNLDKLVHDARTSGLVSLPQFLEHVDRLKQSGTREGEARAIEEGSITLMTVHSAKGLEFPVVVIGDAGYAPQNRNSLLVDHELGPILKLKEANSKLGSNIWSLAARRQKDKDDAEGQRLLYVAATRARELLILNGTDGQKRKTAWIRMMTGGCDVLGNLLEQLKDNPQKCLHDVLQSNGVPVALTITGDEFKTARPEKRAAQDAVILSDRPQLLGPINETRVEMDEKANDANRDPAPRAWRVVYPRKARVSAWTIGSVVHDTIAGWVYEPDSSRPPLLEYLEHRARYYGIIDTSAVKELVRRAMAIVDSLRSSDLHRRIIHAERREHEIAFSIQQGEGQKGIEHTGIIDLLFCENGSWHIIEFKTDQLRHGQTYADLLRDPDNDYAEKLEDYIKAVQTLLGQRPAASICFLRPWASPICMSADEIQQIRQEATL